MFHDAAGKPVATVPVTHVGQRAGVTMLALAEPIVAQRIRWRVTKLGSPHGTVGGAEIAFFVAGTPETEPRRIGIEAQTVQVIERQGGALVQPLKLIARSG